MVSLYYACIYPYLSYSCSVWGNTNKSLLCSLQRATNRAVKATFLLPWLYSSPDLYNDTGIALLDHIIGKSTLYFAHSAFLGQWFPTFFGPRTPSQGPKSLRTPFLRVVVLLFGP